MLLRVGFRQIFGKGFPYKEAQVPVNPGANAGAPAMSEYNAECPLLKAGW